MDSDHTNALANLGSVLIEQGRASEAIYYLNRVITLSPNSADAHYNLGNAFVILKKDKEAVSEFEATIKLTPKFALAHYKLGNLYFSQKDVGQAANEYSAALRLQRDLAEAHYQLGQVLQIRNQVGEAISHLKVAIELKPNWIEALNNLAWIYATDPNALYRDGDEAIQLAKHATDLTTFKDAAVLDTLAAAYAQNQEFDKAVSIAQKAAALSTDKKFTAELKRRLELYRANKPFRDVNGN